MGVDGVFTAEQIREAEKRLMAQLPEGLLCEGAPARTVQQAKAVRLFTQQHVFLHGQMRREGEFLINHGDAAAASVQRVRRGKWMAVEFNLPGVGNISAAQNFH